MPAIDFPAAPAVNDEYSFEGRTWRWNGTGWEVKEFPAALLAGTAANPSLYFSGDPNTGLYSPGADQVALTTAGTQKFAIDSFDGNPIIETSYPTSLPSLDLNFAATKRLDPRITFSRSSTATYVGSDGLIKSAAVNEARFDHDPATSESLGLLVEEARTNLVSYSERFDVAIWAFSYGIKRTPNATVAPDGTLTATLIQQDTSDSIHQLAGGFGSNSGYITLTSTYTLSLYVKYYNSNKIRFMEQHTYGGSTVGSYTKAGIVFDFATESIEKTIQWNGASQSRIAGYSVNKLPNGWYRLNLSVIPGTDTNNQRVYFGIYPQEGNLSAPSSIPSGATGIVGQNYSSGTSVTNFVGDGSTGVYIWGAQVESGAFPTSYIPTPATFTGRSSTATFYNANGVIQTAGSGVARSNAFFPDSNGVFRPAGLLLEAAATNLVTYSEEVDNGAWGKFEVTVTANATTAPDGTNTADSVLETTNATQHRFDTSTTNVTSGTTYTFSLFLKPNGKDTITLQTKGIGSSGEAYADYALTGNGSVTGQANGGIGAIFKLPNGWYRCTLTATASASGTGYGRVFIQGATVGGVGVYAWGAQLETGSVATSYIPTAGSTVTRAADTSTSSTVTRSADVAQITGSNFSSWFNYDQSTMYTEGVFIGDPYNGNFGYLSTFDVGTNDGSFYSRIRIVDSGDYVTFQSTLPSSSSTTGNITIAIGANAKNTLIKQVHSIANAVSASAAVNGTLGTNTISSSIQIPNRVQLGKHGTAYQTTCYLRRFIYWPTRLPDATLQTITK